MSESIGLGLILPLLESIVNPSGGNFRFNQYLSPVLSYFPDHYHFVVLGVLLMVMIVLKNLLLVSRIGYSTFFVFRFKRLWQSAIMENYLYASYPYIISQRQGIMLNNAISEPGRAAKSLQQIIEYISKVVLTVSLYCVLFLADWKITLLLTVVAAAVFAVLRKVSSTYATGVGTKKLKLSQEIADIGAESMNAIRQIKIYAMEGRTGMKFMEKLDSLISIMLKFNIIRRLPVAVVESLAVLLIVTVLLFVKYVKNYPLTDALPLVGLFVVTFQRLIPNVSELFSERMNILTFIPSLKLVHELYTSKTDREDMKRGIPVESLHTDIIFDDVCFSYNESNPLFKNLSIRIPKGKITAFVGPSGSGKSTIVDLLFGFLKKKSGNIAVNGLELDDINLKAWRKLVRYVSQDTFLFNATVRENIIVGKPDATEEEIISAARKANTDIFIEKLPRGYDTNLGDKGLKISGGQRQRIAIARAILSDPEILIFDEATSSLDPESERLIQRSIEEFSNRKTIIIISHRLSTIKNADIIYILDNGRIIESGTFEELETKRGRFYKMQSG